MTAPPSSFTPASAERSALRLLIGGVAKAGKSLTALHLARAITGPDTDTAYHIAVADSEGNSALKYAVRGNEPEDPTAGRYRFLHCPMKLHHPDVWSGLIAEAERALGPGGVIILDSASHEWVGNKGTLQLKDEATPRDGSAWAGWAIVTPLHAKFIDSILRTRLHVIATFRMKTEWVLEDYVDDRGRTKKRPVKVGMGIVARDGTEYEFDVITEINRDHQLHVEGARGDFSALVGRRYDCPSGTDLGADLAALLHGGRERYLAERAPTVGRVAVEPPHTETLADA